MIVLASSKFPTGENDYYYKILSIILRHMDSV